MSWSKRPPITHPGPYPEPCTWQVCRRDFEAGQRSFRRRSGTRQRRRHLQDLQRHLDRSRSLLGSWSELGTSDWRKSTDPMMFIMNDEGMNDLMKGHTKLGADVSAAAGPVGPSASAEAGYKAGVLTSSSSKGAFIGASLNGAELNQNKKVTQELYHQDVSFPDILDQAR
jgi:Las17-binding protein actin regulator